MGSKKYIILGAKILTGSAFLFIVLVTIFHKPTQDIPISGKSFNGDYKIIEIDRCEYIQDARFNRVPLIHKANCKNHHK